MSDHIKFMLVAIAAMVVFWVLITDQDDENPFGSAVMRPEDY